MTTHEYPFFDKDTYWDHTSVVARDIATQCFISALKIMTENGVPGETQLSYLTDLMKNLADRKSEEGWEDEQANAMVNGTLHSLNIVCEQQHPRDWEDEYVKTKIEEDQRCSTIH